MPYITNQTREYLDLKEREPLDAGELNYVLTNIVKRYIQDFEGRTYSFNYQKLNDAIGALEGCKLELYRRIVAPYEDKKITENGDVY